MPTTTRPATKADIPTLAMLVAGSPTQPSTRAAMALFSLDKFADVVNFSQVMISSTGTWKTAIVAEQPQVVGMTQLGSAFLAFTPEIIDFSIKTYGPDFEAFLSPRLGALGRVSASYPENSLSISEIHVSPSAQRSGVGRALFREAKRQAINQEAQSLSLQTLVGNPARLVFERWGFEVTDTLTDPIFQQLTGVPGYHLMMCEL
jgi:ribosomal protein S18 acetylase RimI-like enzyme